MKGVALDYEQRSLIVAEFPDPAAPSAGEVLLRVHEVGICGTDRELSRFAYGYAPPGETRLILGHEALARVEMTGAGVLDVQRGQWVVPTVRRSCDPPCPQCAAGRRDLCVRAANPECGIFGLHGYFRDYAIDKPEDLVRVPEALVDVAVLIEPLSVVEKAIESALRCHQGEPRRLLAMGAGAIGILTALTARLRGLDATICSLEAPDHPRIRALRGTGIEYRTSIEGYSADIVVEAAGDARAAFAGLGALAPLGVMVVLGALSARGEFPFMDLIVGNRTLLGSVNAGPDAFRRAVEDLARFDKRVLERLVSRRRFTGELDALFDPPAGAAKLVHVLEE